jgi:hypothetical protein
MNPCEAAWLNDSEVGDSPTQTLTVAPDLRES